ncbi:MAG: hypothetical protein Q4A01_11130 [Coriobacteriales bacterium]|nr:hypothetical protein [Coriobacteriales bacterium]
MARVSLANEHHGTVWVCQTATFDEGEEREWDSFATHAAFATRTEAVTWASRLAHDYAGVLCLFLAVDGSDGVSVDVQPRVYHGRDYEPCAVNLVQKAFPRGCSSLIACQCPRPRGT